MGGWLLINKKCFSAATLLFTAANKLLAKFARFWSLNFFDTSIIETLMGGESFGGMRQRAHMQSMQRMQRAWCGACTLGLKHLQQKSVLETSWVFDGSLEYKLMRCEFSKISRKRKCRSTIYFRRRIKTCSIFRVVWWLNSRAIKNFFCWTCLGLP